MTNTAVSSARLYWEYKGGFFDVRNVTIPVAVSAFPDEIYQAPKSWAEKAYPKLIYYNRLPKGGHFAAWEQPELFTTELRASFKFVLVHGAFADASSWTGVIERLQAQGVQVTAPANPLRGIAIDSAYTASLINQISWPRACCRTLVRRRGDLR